MRGIMPFASKAQARYLFSQHPEVAKEFASKTPSIKALPDHVQKFSRNKTGVLAAKRRKR